MNTPAPRAIPAVIRKDQNTLSEGATTINITRAKAMTAANQNTIFNNTQMRLSCHAPLAEDAGKLLDCSKYFAFSSRNAFPPAGVLLCFAESAPTDDPGPLRSRWGMGTSLGAGGPIFFSASIRRVTPS